MYITTTIKIVELSRESCRMDDIELTRLHLLLLCSTVSQLKSSNYPNNVGIREECAYVIILGYIVRKPKLCIISYLTAVFILI